MKRCSLHAISGICAFSRDNGDLLPLVSLRGALTDFRVLPKASGASAPGSLHIVPPRRVACSSSELKNHSGKNLSPSYLDGISMTRSETSFA